MISNEKPPKTEAFNTNKHSDNDSRALFFGQNESVKRSGSADKLYHTHSQKEHKKKHKKSKKHILASSNNQIIAVYRTSLPLI